MRVICPGDEFDSLDARRSIFLAGPTPRDVHGTSWRDEAIGLIDAAGLYDVSFRTVFSPEIGNGKWLGDYDGQVGWEHMGLELASVIMFWVPREIQHMPAFTTNVEFGMYMESGRIVLGYPTDAPKMKYLDWHARRLCIPVRHSLPETVDASITMLTHRLRP